MSDKENYVTLNVSDGTKMEAYTAFPSDKSKSYPGLILFQEAGGVNDYVKRVVDRFAAEGYIVIAPELFHRAGEPAFVTNVMDMSIIMPQIQALTKEGLEADIIGSWDWLQNNSQVQHENIGCVGYCMGGRTAFLANTILPFKAAVSYYGGGIVPELIKSARLLHADMLFFWGGLDQHITSDKVKAVADGLRSANKPFTNIEFSNADHGFFRDGSDVYNEIAAKESWAITLAYFQNRLQ